MWRPDSDPARTTTVAPGEFTFAGSPDSGFDGPPFGRLRLAQGGADYRVVWWDPHALALDAGTSFGLRRDDLIAKDGDAAGSAQRLAAYRAWESARAAAIAGGRRRRSVRAPSRRWPPSANCRCSISPTSRSTWSTCRASWTAVRTALRHARAHHAGHGAARRRRVDRPAGGGDAGPRAPGLGRGSGRGGLRGRGGGDGGAEASAVRRRPRGEHRRPVPPRAAVDLAVAGRDADRRHGRSRHSRSASPAPRTGGSSCSTSRPTATWSSTPIATGGSWRSTAAR